MYEGRLEEAFEAANTLTSARDLLHRDRVLRFPRFLLPAMLIAAGAVGRAQTPDITPTTTVPDQEPVSSRFQLAVDGQSVPVYLARISSLTADQRKHLGPPVISGTDLTSFASFDVGAPVQVAITCAEEIKSIKVLPAGSDAAPVVSGHGVTFTVTRPEKLTVEVNGNWVNALHLFGNAPETDVPKPDDPNVIYYGPGVHRVGTTIVKSGQTVYLAPGAVLYGTLDGGKPKAAIFMMLGDHATLRGRGIIDASLCPRGTRAIVGIYGTHIRVEGVVLRDCGGFNVPVRRASDVEIANIKVFGWRGNSDGTDICNSHHVRLTDSFYRTFDDLIVLKTDLGQGDESDIQVDHCVLWNEFAHALSLGAELREPLSDVRFSDCDIIHDKGREWLLRIFDADSGAVKNVVYQNIRIEEARRLMSVWIGRAVWSKQPERGHIDNVTFQNITSVAPEVAWPAADLVGFDATHAVNQVQFQNVQIAGQPLTRADVRQNAFVHGVTVQP
jgi:hypothetical protein